MSNNASLVIMMQCLRTIYVSPVFKETGPERERDLSKVTEQGNGKERIKIQGPGLKK